MRHAALLALGAMAVTSCDWRKLDDAVARAPVSSVSAPDGYKATDFGRAIVALPPPKGGTAVARYLVGGTLGAGALAVVDIDAAGAIKTTNVPDSVLGEFLTLKSPVKSFAALDDGKVYIGTPNFGVSSTGPPRGRTLYLDLMTNPGGGLEFSMKEASINVSTGQSYFGLAVAVGNLKGTGGRDKVVAAKEDVSVIFDGDDRKLLSTGADCNVAIGEALVARTESFRALAVANLVEDPADEIAVGVPNENAPGKVVILKLSMNGNALSCPTTIIGVAGAPRFGASIAVGDLDGDDKPDLVVGAPPDRAYWYKGPFAKDVPEPTGTLTLQMTGRPEGSATGDFGIRVAVANVDGIPGNEIVVSAIDLAVDGVAAAGQVFIFAPDAPDGRLLTKVNDLSPETGSLYGIALAELRFAAPPCATGSGGQDRTLLVVGSATEVYTYFKLPGVSATDPRCLRK